jgi:SAM-dependent methyltransferase
MAIVKRGKPLGDVVWFHDSFESQESEYIYRQLCTENSYLNGQPRKLCILCHEEVSENSSFFLRDVRYARCSYCGHINGMHEISSSFLEFAYTQENLDDSSKTYAKEFTEGKMSQDFLEVVRRIYLPKVKFLQEALRTSNGKNSNNLKILDFGCGSGHFVSALNLSGFTHVIGVDALAIAVDEANTHGLADKVKLVELDSEYTILKNSELDVVTMMCVLPHLENPTKAIESMLEGGVRYTFQKIPMWSIGSILDVSFPAHRSRVIGADHTNLFTWESIEWLENKYGLKRIGSWSFGSDALDLMRHVRRSLTESASPDFVSWNTRYIERVLEPMQESIDLCDLSSELHVVWELSQ